MANITLRLPDDIHKDLTHLVKDNNATMNATIVDVLAGYITEQKASTTLAHHATTIAPTIARISPFPLTITPTTSENATPPNNWQLTPHTLDTTLHALHPFPAWRSKAAIYDILDHTNHALNTEERPHRAAAHLTAGFAAHFPLATGNHETGLTLGLALLKLFGEPLNLHDTPHNSPLRDLLIGTLPRITTNPTPHTAIDALANDFLNLTETP